MHIDFHIVIPKYPFAPLKGEILELTLACFIWMRYGHGADRSYVVTHQLSNARIM